MSITQYLIDQYEFVPLIKTRSNTELDYNQFTCVRRVHVMHYLYYSEIHKCFSIAIRYDKPKGKAGGGFIKEESITLPKVIYNTNEVDLFLKAFINENN